MKSSENTPWYPKTVYGNILAFEKKKKFGQSSYLSSKLSNSLINDGGAKALYIHILSSVVNLRQGGSSPLQFSFTLTQPPSRELLLISFYQCDKKLASTIHEKDISKNGVFLSQIFIPVNCIHMGNDSRFTLYLEDSMPLSNYDMDAAMVAFKRASERKTGLLRVNINFTIAEAEPNTIKPDNILSDPSNHYTNFPSDQMIMTNPSQIEYKPIQLSQLKKSQYESFLRPSNSYNDLEVTPQDSASNFGGVAVKRSAENKTKAMKQMIRKLSTQIKDYKDTTFTMSILNLWRTLAHERYFGRMLYKILKPLVPVNQVTWDNKNLKKIVKNTASKIDDLESQLSRTTKHNQELSEKNSKLKGKYKKSEEMIFKIQERHNNYLRDFISANLHDLTHDIDHKSSIRHVHQNTTLPDDSFHSPATSPLIAHNTWDFQNCNPLPSQFKQPELNVTKIVNKKEAE